MPSKGLADLLTILIILLSFIIGLFFKGKLIGIRYAFFSICLVFVIGAFFNNFFKSDMQVKREQELSGEYKLDFKNSKFDSVDLSSHSTVVLKLKPDNTFYIKNGNQFFKETSGKWELLDNGDFEYIEYSFTDSPPRTKTGGDLGVWNFNVSELKSDNDGNELTFKK